MRKVLEPALVGRIRNCAFCSLVGLIRKPLWSALVGLMRNPLLPDLPYLIGVSLNV